MSFLQRGFDSGPRCLSSVECVANHVEFSKQLNENLETFMSHYRLTCFSKQ